MTTKLDSIFIMANKTCRLSKMALLGCPGKYIQFFANYFSTVYVEPVNLNTTIPTLLSNNNLNLHEWSISEHEIYEHLNSLDVYSGSGLDGVPPVFLKNCRNVLVKPLYIIFNKSLKMGIFPEIWKNSYTTPLHTSGDKANVCNYRPISKFSAIPKIFESIITKKLSLLMSQQLVNNQQGFRQKKSILTNLILYQTKIILAFNDG